MSPTSESLMEQDPRWFLCLDFPSEYLDIKLLRLSSLVIPVDRPAWEAPAHLSSFLIPCTIWIQKAKKELQHEEGRGSCSQEQERGNVVPPWSMMPSEETEAGRLWGDENHRVCSWELEL